jgi:tryptophanase
VKEISRCADIIYFSARKLGSARGGGIATFEKKYYQQMRDLVPFYEGFITYGGMSTREMEAIAIGLDEALDFEMINQGPQFIAEFCKELQTFNVPIVTPPGGLGCHVNAREFLKHVKGEEYPAASLVAAIYIVCGCRGMERGTVSEERNPDGSEHLASVELVRLALPRRVFTLSQIKFAADRIGWLYKNRQLVGGLEFVEEPKVLRFFLGRLQAKGDWPKRLIAKFKQDFPDSL